MTAAADFFPLFRGIVCDLFMALCDAFNEFSPQAHECVFVLYTLHTRARYMLSLIELESEPLYCCWPLPDFASVHLTAICIC